MLAHPARHCRHGSVVCDASLTVCEGKFNYFIITFVLPSTESKRATQAHMLMLHVECHSLRHQRGEGSVRVCCRVTLSTRWWARRILCARRSFALLHHVMSFVRQGGSVGDVTNFLCLQKFADWTSSDRLFVNNFNLLLNDFKGKTRWNSNFRKCLELE